MTIGLSLDDARTLLLQNHHLETLKVVQLGAGLLLGSLLGSVRLGPLASNTLLVKALLHSLAVGTTGHLVQDHLGQKHVAEQGDVAGNASGRAVHQGAVLVDDLDDDRQLALVLTLLQQGDATDFDKSGVHLQSGENVEECD